MYSPALRWRRYVNPCVLCCVPSPQVYRKDCVTFVLAEALSTECCVLVGMLAGLTRPEARTDLRTTTKFGTCPERLKTAQAHTVDTNAFIAGCIIAMPVASLPSPNQSIA